VKVNLNPQIPTMSTAVFFDIYRRDLLIIRLLILQLRSQAISATKQAHHTRFTEKTHNELPCHCHWNLSGFMHAMQLNHSTHSFGMVVAENESQDDRKWSTKLSLFRSFRRRLAGFPSLWCFSGGSQYWEELCHSLSQNGV
jgi:hypothetical protein